MIRYLLTYLQNKAKGNLGQGWSLKRASQTMDFNVQRPCRFRKNQKGQILIEYILLLILVLGVAKILMDGLIKRDQDPDAQGIVIKAWVKASQTIAQDAADHAD